MSQVDNQSLWGALSRSVPGDEVRLVLYLGIAVVIVAVLGFSSWRSRNNRDARRLIAAAYPVAALILSPGSWVVHFVHLALPFSAGMKEALAKRNVYVLLVIIAAFALTTLSGVSRWSVHASTHGSWYLAGAFSLGALVVVLGNQTVTRERP